MQQIRLNGKQTQKSSWLPCIARLGLVLSWLPSANHKAEKSSYSQPGRWQGPNYVFVGLTHQYCLPCYGPFCPSGFIPFVPISLHTLKYSFSPAN